MIAIVPVPPVAGKLYAVFICVGEKPEGDVFVAAELTRFNGWAAHPVGVFADTVGASACIDIMKTMAVNKMPIRSFFFLLLLDNIFKSPRKVG